MGNAVKGLGRVRKLFEAIDAESPGAEGQFTLTDQLAQNIALDASLYGDIYAKGRAFRAGMTAAVAAVVAIPTVAVMFAIYNNEPDGGRSLIIDRVYAQNVVTTSAVAAQAQLLALVGQVREAAPADAMPANQLSKMNGFGGSQFDTRVRAILAGTNLPATTGLAGWWIPVGQSAQKPNTAAVTVPGYGMEALISGRMIVPPGRYFAIHVVANVVGETFIAGVEWHEKQLRLG